MLTLRVVDILHICEPLCGFMPEVKNPEKKVGPAGWK